jgi:hypothetical protein
MTAKAYQLMHMAYGGAAVIQAQVVQWFLYFKEGEMSVESDEYPGCCSTNRNMNC